MNIKEMRKKLDTAEYWDSVDYEKIADSIIVELLQEKESENR